MPSALALVLSNFGDNEDYNIIYCTLDLGYLVKGEINI
jgi:hypothetical protein